jgi:hypothetical protein
MTKKEFNKYLARDQWCLHCGLQDDTLIPQHRRNRGMGGSESRSKPSNVIVLCSQFNGLIEASEVASRAAQKYGWKLREGQEPDKTPVFDSWLGVWWLLTDKFGRIEVKP